MALKISQADIMRMKDQADRLKARAKNASEKAGQSVETIVRTAEIGSAAFTFGLINGRYEDVKVLGVRADLAAGLGLHLAALLGFGGNMSNHLHAFGDGALASYLGDLGRGTGVAWLREGQGTSGVHGSLPGGARAGERLTQAELEALSR